MPAISCRFEMPIHPAAVAVKLICVSTVDSRSSPSNKATHSSRHLPFKIRNLLGFMTRGAVLRGQAKAFAAGAASAPSRSWINTWAPPGSWALGARPAIPCRFDPCADGRAGSWTNTGTCFDACPRIAGGAAGTGSASRRRIINYRRACIRSVGIYINRAYAPDHLSDCGPAPFGSRSRHLGSFPGELPKSPAKTANRAGRPLP
jgi:hypothetical protein